MEIACVQPTHCHISNRLGLNGIPDLPIHAILHSIATEPTCFLVDRSCKSPAPGRPIPSFPDFLSLWSKPRDETAATLKCPRRRRLCWQRLPHFASRMRNSSASWSSCGPSSRRPSDNATATPSSPRQCLGSCCFRSKSGRRYGNMLYQGGFSALKTSIRSTLS